MEYRVIFLFKLFPIKYYSPNKTSRLYYYKMFIKRFINIKNTLKYEGWKEYRGKRFTRLISLNIQNVSYS